MIGALLTLVVLSGAAPSCPVEQARYVLRETPGVTAAFRPIAPSADWPAGVVLEVQTGGGGGRRYDFLPYQGNGVGGRGHLASTRDAARPGWTPPGPDDGKARPLGDLDYLLFDAGYGVRDEPVLRRGQPAPAHLLIPDLQQALWYRTASDARDSVPTAFFDLTGCTG